MIRDLDRLAGRTFDLLVVGGGIYGLTIAYDAAQRGLSVGLVERDDFGSGTSFNHLRTIHGGLRYLQKLDIRHARESMKERRTLARIAPHAVHLLPVVVPVHRSLLAGKTAMRLGFMVDRLVGFDRNKGVPSALRIPGGRIVSKSEAAIRYPGLRRRGATGAAVWHDYITVESDRLTFSFAIAANEHGAILVNHLEASSLVYEGKRVTGVRVRDSETGRELEIAAHLTVNATGASVDRLLEPLGLATGMPLLKAMNLVTTRAAGEEALGARTASGRHLFLVPWRGRALLGTWESQKPPESGAAEASSVEVNSFIAELNQAFPALDLNLGDVTLVHRGVVPAARGSDGTLGLEGHEQVRDHTADGVEGLVSVAGTKYTTARVVAERVVNRVVAKLRRSPLPCRTATTLLPGGSVRDPSLTIAEARRDHDAGLPSDTIPHLVAAYGSRYRDVLALARDKPEWCARVADGSPVIGAQLVWAVRKEMAMKLSDAVIRRTPLGALGYPGDGPAERAAGIIGGLLGWSEEQKHQEIGLVKQFYAIA
jgi:glycerol-3-phosphate dehydrogenase